MKLNHMQQERILKEFKRVFGSEGLEWVVVSPRQKTISDFA
jgi:hypothetical protein